MISFQEKDKQNMKYEERDIREYLARGELVFALAAIREIHNLFICQKLFGSRIDCWQKMKS